MTSKKLKSLAISPNAPQAATATSPSPRAGAVVVRYSDSYASVVEERCSYSLAMYRFPSCVSCPAFFNAERALLMLCSAALSLRAFIWSMSS